jgi:hypothetical protein
MNLAIVIGVSKYSDTKNNLPGCKNDAEAIHKILQKTDKFNPILYINNEETSAKTKELIIKFITEHKGKQIDELFFYFSGHGEFSNNEFYYLLSDYDTKKKNQTSLQNNEMDDLIKTLNPNLVVKVIDACQSGTSYIKESNILDKFFTDSKKGFNKCYFLNSSLNNQSSYQDKTISYFTNSFVNALREHTIDEIRYKDIIDVISDDFANNTEQTPFFVIQADLTEKFCVFSTALRDYLKTFEKPKLGTSESEDKAISIADLVKQDAKNYIDKKGAIKSLEYIREHYVTIKLSGELNELYLPEVEFLESYQSVEQMGVVVNWIKKNPNSYFATPIYHAVYDEFGNEYWESKEFELKVDVPYKTISINLINNYQNISSYSCKIVFLLSRKSIRFFYYITNYIEESWDSKTINTADIKWVTTETSIANDVAILDGIKTINQSFLNRIEKDINDKFNISDNQDETEGQTKSDLPF